VGSRIRHARSTYEYDGAASSIQPRSAKNAIARSGTSPASGRHEARSVRQATSTASGVRPIPTPGTAGTSSETPRRAVTRAPSASWR
jgi:hypothetical protein